MDTRSATRKVLIVDDDKAIRRMLNRALGFFGYDVIEATNGREALTLFNQERPDIVVSDIYMPVMNGIHLLRAIRKAQKNAKVVLMTGYGHFAQLAADENSRPDGYFEKPVYIPQLVATMEELLD